ncbi:YjiH family protein [Alkaliphilus peptidifermentans]|uniref:Nucleoside recognition GATE domain-containing membrane protein YjiH n=1 Tax=Alkaliphilus peptidifermentans DSM 18978 TaxID=1120976 RepID=A0A1G5J2T7_9FIRM|nr:YjiH family protein [Alkaliphilus peptidifermentans]SCY82018.1 nucleoside recognition GATE domain-containing membrane protein YjiH [Alkaliphilus peptidifermentans DSM 18978]
MNTDKTMSQYNKIHNKSNIIKFIIFSFIGIFVYFIPFTISGTKTIMLDHLVTAITIAMPRLGSSFALGMIILGGLVPFYEKNWNKDINSVIMSGLKALGILLGMMAFFNLGPEWLMREDMLPLLFNTIVIPVAIMVPLGSLFLTFITGYGLLGFLGVILKPVMQPIWKVPGTAAVNVVASFVGSFSVGILMTNNLFKEGKYTRREAAIIVTSFSTVSATFMVIIAKRLGLMSIWNTFFWTTLIITFIVSAITARLKPLSAIKSEYINDYGIIEAEPKEKILNSALNAALKEIENNKSTWRSIISNLKEGIYMTLRFLPLILSIGVISFYLVKMTFFFDIIGYIFYPIIYILNIPEPWMVAKAISTVGAEVLTPAIIMSSIEAPIAARFVTGVVSISSILFFSGSIPCIISTDINISIKDIFLILMERIIITLVLVTPLMKILF